LLRFSTGRCRYRYLSTRPRPVWSRSRLRMEFSGRYRIEDGQLTHTGGEGPGISKRWRFPSACKVSERKDISASRLPSPSFQG
jgi:hypothetical protein